MVETRQGHAVGRVQFHGGGIGGGVAGSEQKASFIHLPLRMVAAKPQHGELGRKGLFP